MLKVYGTLAVCTLAACKEPVRYIVPHEPVEIVMAKDAEGVKKLATMKFAHGMQIEQIVPQADGGFLVVFQWNLDAATAQRVELFR